MMVCFFFLFGGRCRLCGSCSLSCTSCLGLRLSGGEAAAAACLGLHLGAGGQVEGVEEAPA